MRLRSVVLALAPVLAFVACGDSDSGPTAPADAGSDATFDATPVVDASPNADASPDASADAALDGAVADSSVDASSADADAGLIGVIDCPAIMDGGTEGGADAADDGGDAAIDGGDAGDGGVGTRIRIVASNLTSGNSQAYEAPGIDILRGLSPDVVLFQEFNYKLGTIRQLVDTALGPTFCVYREPRVGGIPNGIASRYRIVDAGQWADPNTPDRSMVWARIDVPGPTDLWAVSLHLHTGSASTRAAQAQLLVQQVGNTVPDGDYLAFGGDLNADTETETALVTLGAIGVTTAPWPLDQNANNHTNAPRNKPYDWVIANTYLQARKTPVVIGASNYPSGLVFDTRVYTPLSEVPPVVSTDSAASNMQHMAIAKDFIVGP